MTRFQNWFQTRSPRGQWAMSCAGVVAIVSFCLYGLGLASYVARPLLVTTPPMATVVFVFPTAEPRPTILFPTAPPTFALPGSTLEATPTQAPLPTRAPPTATTEFILDPEGTPMTVTPSPELTSLANETQTP